MTISGVVPKQVGDPTSPGSEANESLPEQNPLSQQKIKTSLILTLSQEQKMVERALLRIDELSSQMGLYLDGTGMVDATRWMGLRMKIQDQYDNNWTWRAALGGIFSYSIFLSTSPSVTRD